MIRSRDKTLVVYEYATVIKVESFSTRTYEYFDGQFARIFHTPILVCIGEEEEFPSSFSGDDGLLSALYAIGELS